LADPLQVYSLEAMPKSLPNWARLGLPAAGAFLAHHSLQKHDEGIHAICQSESKQQDMATLFKWLIVNRLQ
jgi:hypothetical protein